MAAPWYRADRATVHLAVCLLTPVTAATLLFVPSASIRFVVLCIAAGIMPGTAILAGAKFRHLSAAFALVVVTSLTVDGCLALALIWGRWFHPAAPAAVIGVASSIWLFMDFRQRRAVTRSEPAPPKVPAGAPSSRGTRRARRRQAAARRATERRLPAPTPARVPRDRFRHLAIAVDFGPLLVGFALWLASLSSIDLSRLGNGGLLGIAPASWYVALVLLTFGSVHQAWASRNGWLLAGYLGSLALMLTATIPAVASAPEYSWVYKHIAVTQLLIARGSVSPNLDIYNRFPGMFALAAMLTKLTGLSPLAYANWVQPVFTWLVLLLIYAIGFTITANRRIAAIAALLFLCANWIGQIYLSPQTLALTLFLGFLLLVIGERARPGPSPLVSSLCAGLRRLLGRHVGSWFGPADAEPFGPAALIEDRLVVILLIAADFLIVASHQLTPYMLLIAYGLLVLTRSVKGRWLWLACVVVTLGYLAPNYGYLQQHYGLLQSFSLSNAVGVTTFGLPSHRPALYADSGTAVTFITLVTALASCLTLLRKGHRQKGIILLALALAAAGILAGQDYGGEGPLRVFLFSLPWQAILIAYALTQMRARIAVPVLATLTTVVLGFCLLTTLGNSATSVIPGGEVQAALYLNDHIPSGSAVIAAGSNFPVKLGARYPDYAKSQTNAAPDLFNDQPGLAKPMSAAETARRIASEIRGYADHGVIVFSWSQYRVAAVDHTLSVARMRAIEDAVANSPQFKLWYRNSVTRIYELRQPSAGSGP